MSGPFCSFNFCSKVFSRNPPDDRFRPFYERAKREGWGAHDIDASHNPHITCSEVLADLLSRIAV